MHKIRCLIVDDEPVAQRIIEGYLNDLPEFEVVGKCLNALDARILLQREQVDLMFLDLEMPKLKGFPFLKTLTNPPAIIITTAYREYALEGYEFEILDYLLKPISFERFLKAINRFKSKRENVKTTVGLSEKAFEYLYVKSERKTLKLRQEHILFIEGMNNYIQINTAKEKHLVYDSLANILTKLGTQFFRIHKSFIVNKDMVRAYNQEQLEIGDTFIPVGQKYKDIIKEI